MPSEDGEIACFDKSPAAADCHLEWRCKTLGELRERETKSDVFFGGLSNVSVECKLTETVFTPCSQPLIKPAAPNYKRDHCDGSYSVQRSRADRCSLSSKGILYWKHVSAIFEWSADSDHLQCPIRIPYQLVRNILAARLGHAVLVYDIRNPAFLSDGERYGIWRALRKSLRDSSRLRRCSWQRIIGALEHDPDLNEFVRELKAKYLF